MGDFIWFGTVLGAVLGALHFLQFLASRLGRAKGHNVHTYWHALWIWALWTLLGAYVLAFWLLGLVLYVIARPFGRKAAAR